MPRKALSARTRFEIFKRDLFTCQYCGGHPPEVILHVDHIRAIANGGDNSTENLVTSCDRCNFGKSAVPLTSIPPSLGEHAARIAESEKQLKGYYAIIRKQRDRVEAEAWRVAEIYQPGCSQNGINKQDMSSIRRFLDKLDLYTVMDAMSAAKIRMPYSDFRAFKYFCGTCWRIIRGDNGQNATT